MNEKTLNKIALLTTVLGLLFLWWYSQNTVLESFAHMNELPAEKEIAVHGVVTRVSKQDQVWFLEVDGETVEKIPVILFPEEEVFLQEGDYVELRGTVKKYQGKKEVVASEVRVKGSEGRY